MGYVDTQNTLNDIRNSTELTNAAKVQSRMGQSSLDQDAFLQLLMTQLKYQDPLNPMSNQDFMAQQAQFTQVSELQKINKNLSSSNEMMQASSLIGKEVTATDPDDDTKTVQGVVSEAKFSSDGTMLVVGEREIPISNVTKIKEASTQADG